MQEDLRVDVKAHQRKLAVLAEDREKMKNLMASLESYKQLNTLDQKGLVAVSRPRTASKRTCSVIWRNVE